jgi:Tol biopolymer transport system component
MRRSRVLLLSLLAVGAACPPVAAAWRPAPGTTSLVSVATNGAAGNGGSFAPALSGNGRFVAFASGASDLVPGQPGGVFLRDMRKGITQPVSVAADGSRSVGSYPSISRNARFVAFESGASNLVAGDTNGALDVFVRDLRRGVVRRVSVAADGSEVHGFSFNGAISPDGRYAAFESSAPDLVPGDANQTFDVFVRNLRTGRLEVVSVGLDGGLGNDSSESPAVSARGRRVAFESFATNLAAGDTPRAGDIFVRDLRARRTRLVSVAASGGPANEGSWDPSISADGRYVAFNSDASNLVPGDTNGSVDVFVRDLRTGVTRRASVLPDGTQAPEGATNGALSANGRVVGFTVISREGLERILVYARDLRRGRTELASVAPDGSPQNGRSYSLRWGLSGDGRMLGFTSAATNLVAGFHTDFPGTDNVYVRSLLTG